MQERYVIFPQDGRAGRGRVWSVDTSRDRDSLLGKGGEAEAYPIKATAGGRGVPVVLKTYDQDYDSDFMFTYERTAELTEIFVERQLAGYGLLARANRQLKARGLPGFSIPDTVRRAEKTTNRYPAIVMTDLTGGGQYALVEVKLLFVRFGRQQMLEDVLGPIRVAASAKNLDMWTDIAVDHIKKDLARAAKTDIVFRPHEDIPSYNIHFNTQFPHQFTSWSLLVNRAGDVIPMIHDFSSVFVRTPGSDTTYVTRGLGEIVELS